MKCKIFESSYASSLEDRVNEWLITQKSIDIQDIRMVCKNSNVSSYSSGEYIILILYSERRDKLENLDYISKNQ